MDKGRNLFYNLFDGYLVPWTRKVLDIPYMRALRETFMLMMPLFILLTLLSMFGSLMVNPAGPLMSEDGLGLGTFLSGGLHGQSYRNSDFYSLLVWLSDFINIISFLNYLIFSMLFTDRLSRLYRTDRMLSVLCTLTGYIFLLAIFKEGMADISLYFRGRGFFIALFISTVTVLSFRKFATMRIFHPPLAEGLPSLMEYSMSRILILCGTLIVAFCTVSGWMMLEEHFASVPMILKANFSMDFAQHPLVAMGYELVRRFLWWLGLNGNGLTFCWNEAFYLPAQALNELEGGRYIFTREFFDAVPVSLLGLAISIWVFSKQRRMRSISAYSLPCLIFSINEPFLFALPIVLNPLFLLPYLMAPIANVLIGYLAIDYGVVPLFRYAVESGAPLLLEGILATGDVMGAVLQLVWLSVDIIIYTPFVIVFNLLHEDEEFTAEEVREL